MNIAAGASRNPGGGISYSEISGYDGTGERIVNFAVSLSGEYLNAANENVGTLVCGFSASAPPQSFMGIVSDKYRGAALDSVTIRQLRQPLSQTFGCDIYYNTTALDSCTAALQLSTAKCGKSSSLPTGKCQYTYPDFTATTKTGGCDAEAAASTVMVVVQCGPKRYELAPTGLTWSKTVVDPKP